MQITFIKNLMYEFYFKNITINILDGKKFWMY